MEKRKRCVDCKRYLIAFQGVFLHPETPCSGISDYVDIRGTISDEFLNKKFVDIYGKPEIDDYDRLNDLERNPLIKIIIICSSLLSKTISKFYPKN